MAASADWQKRQGGIGGIISGILGGGNGQTTSASPASSSPSSDGTGGSAGSGSSTTSNVNSQTQTSGSASTTSDLASATTTTQSSLTTETSTRVTAAPTSSSSSLSVVVTSVTSNGQLVPVTRTQTVVVVNPSASSDAQAGGTSSGSSNNGALIGGVVGGVVGGLALIAIAAILFVLLKRRKERTGSAYFLCFGKRPKYGEKGDLDYSAGNWPSFDPSSAAYGAAAQHGRSASGGRATRGLPPATLPAVEDDPETEGGVDQSSHQHAGYEYGSAEAMSDSPGTRERLGSWNDGYGSSHGPTTAGASPAWSPIPMNFAPDYSHLDDPQTRKERQAAAAAAASTRQSSLAGPHSGTAPNSPPAHAHSASGYQQGSDPRPQSADSTLLMSGGNSPGKDDGLEGTAVSGGYDADEQDPVPQLGERQPLHLANP